MTGNKIDVRARPVGLKLPKGADRKGGLASGEQMIIRDARRTAGSEKNLT